ncbi:hypothetical protein [Spongiactinospora gelatinilytica]|uniref:hypothetical protein n=1 Tax=Spongiactinospora gelatinilytica TaxID=2666298 RepID=UPI0018F3CAF2|nr:hypothetical protein [Spongiactinospora gelatinilytica]
MTRRQVYDLTEAGRDLFAVIVAARQWGERHAFAPEEPRSVLVDSTGGPLPEMRPVDSRGRYVGVEGTSVVRES